MSFGTCNISDGAQILTVWAEGDVVSWLLTMLIFGDTVIQSLQFCLMQYFHDLDDNTWVKPELTKNNPLVKLEELFHNKFFLYSVTKTLEKKRNFSLQDKYVQGIEFHLVDTITN